MYNQLTDKQAEQLFCLAEEAGEVVQAVSKILRHVHGEYSPHDESKTTNKQNLIHRKEIVNGFSTETNIQMAGGRRKRC